MTGIDTIVSEPVVQAIGWALLHFVWQGALIAVTAAVALHALRTSAADVRYVVATIALALMATMPVVTGVQVYRSLIESGAPSALTIGSAEIAAPLPPTLPSDQPARSIVPIDEPTILASTRGFEPWIPLVVSIWMGGVLLLAMRLAGGWLLIKRMASQGAAAADAPLAATVLRLTRRLHISRSVRLLVSPGVDVPTVIGWLKPTILLPASALSGLSPLQIEAILAHELAHIRRHDYLVNLLQTLLETLLFYHPAVWWLSGRIRAEREHCCDDLAVSLCGDPVVYARALADMEELRGPGSRLVLAASGGPLLGRIRRLLAAPATHAGRGPAWIAAGAAIVLMLGIVASAGGRQPVAAQGQTLEASTESLRVLLAHAIHALQNLDTLLMGPPQSPPAPPTPVAVPARPAPPAPPPPPAPSSTVERPAYAGIAPPDLPPAPMIPAAPAAPMPAPPSPREGSAPVLPAPAPPPPPHATGVSMPAPSMPAAPSLPVPPAPPSFAMDTQGGSGTISVSNNGERFEVKYQGSFELTADDSDVARMSPGSYLRISEGRWLQGQSVELQADAAGNITRRYYVGSRERPFEPEGRAWLKQNLLRFIRMSGFDAKGRVARIYKGGGADAVLKEIGLIDGGHAKRTYYMELLRLAPADASVARRILAQAATELESDYEMATLLIDSADKLLLDEATRKGYFEAARTIQSDYEMKRVYTTALKRGTVSPALLAEVLDAARGLGSDYEAATLLTEIARSYDIRGVVRAPFFAVVATLDSAYEKGRVLQAVLRRGALPDETLADVLTAAATLKGNHETGQVLQLVAQTQSVSGPSRDAYVKIAERLGSYEQNQALAALVRGERR